MHDCEQSGICRELNDLPGENDFEVAYGGSPPSRKIVEAGDWVILSDISPLVAGHILVMPRTHHSSLSNMRIEELAALAKLMQDIAGPYRRAFGEVTWVEHGSNGIRSHRACLDHAHMHGVPVSLRHVIEEQIVKRVDLRDVSDLSGRPPGRRYLYLEEGGSSSLYVYEGTAAPQLIRQLISRSLRQPEGSWDWTLVVRQNLLVETIGRLRTSLAAT